jgi:hypothetical protein
LLVALLALVAAVSTLVVVVTRSHATSKTGPTAAAQPLVTAKGTMLDSMTERPVVAAAVAAGAARSTRTDARGAFQLPGLRPDTSLAIRARDYAPTTVAAGGEPLSVRLTPIPVSVRVTSALTGHPLRATLSLPDRSRVAVNAFGAATVYRVGPGDPVTVSAANHRQTTVSVAPDRTVRANLQVISWQAAAPQILAWVKAKQYAALANWVLSPASGYQFYLSPPTNTSGVVDVDGQVVGETATANLSVFPFGSVDISGSFEGGGSRAVLAAQRAWHGTLIVSGGPPGPPPRATAWHRSPMEVTVIGDDLAVTDKIMAGILAALPSG